MSSLFDAPVHLVALLAAVIAGHDPSPMPAVSTVRAEVNEQGLYGFSETAWLMALSQGHGGSETEPYKGRIFATSGGHIYVPVLAEMREIMAKRSDEALARTVALNLARSNARDFNARLHRPANAKDLFAAHVFGIDLAVRLSQLNAGQPTARVAAVLPEVAESYPEAALARGVPVTIADFYRKLPGSLEETTVAFAAPIDIDRLIANAPEHVQIERAAPLRGVIRGSEPPEAEPEMAGIDSKVAALDWTVNVQRQP